MKRYSRKFHARINESIKQYKATAMGKNGQKGVTGLDFRAGLKATEEQKNKNGNAEKKVKA
jgi:hypothetical protein